MSDLARLTRIRPMWLALAVTLAMPLTAEAQSASEYQTKAAFLYSFAKFVEWPADAFLGPEAPLVIGIVGKDPFGRDIDDVVRGRTAGGRNVEIRRLEAGNAQNCHILFVTATERKHLSEILGTLKPAPILTVSDIENFALSGGMIGLLEDAGHIRLEINIDATRRAGLKVSSKLVGTATSVKEERGQHHR